MSKFPKIGIIVAGGLSSETIGILKPILQYFPGVSIDAQGRLRPSHNALDPINLKMSKEYFRKGELQFQEYD